MAQPFLHTSTHSSCVNDASGQHLSSVEESSRLFSAKPKKPSHSLKQYDVVPSSTSDHYSDQSDDPCLSLAEPRNILINQNTNLGPDIYLLPQRRISPLSSDIGLLSLS